jgi:hypothetical protein
MRELNLGTRVPFAIIARVSPAKVEPGSANEVSIGTSWSKFWAVDGDMARLTVRFSSVRRFRIKGCKFESSSQEIVAK